jgi:hypothetical protein
MSELDDIVVDIAGTPVEFILLKRDAVWMAQGSWRDHAVQRAADHNAPDRLQLQTVRVMPTAYPPERQAHLRRPQRTRGAITAASR